MSKKAQKAIGVTVIGLGANIFLFICKWLAATTGHSSALMAEAVHTFSDSITDLVVILGIIFSNKPRDKTHDYGHGKIETLASALLGLGLLYAGAQILFQGTQKIAMLVNGEKLPDLGILAFYVAGISMVIKEILYRFTIKAGRKNNSQAVIANAMDHRADAVASIGTIIGVGGTIFLGEKGRFLDPAAAVLLSLFILWTASGILKKSINELLEASLNDETEKNMLDHVRKVPGVLNPHDLRTRRIGNNIAVDIHIEVHLRLNITEAHNISIAVEERLKSLFGKQTFISVHVEPAAANQKNK